MTRLSADDIKQTIFGVSDGMTSALGVVIPLAIAHKPMFVVIFGLAICASIGMGGGEFLSDKAGRLRSALAMAIATFGGTILPALPFLVLGYHLALVVAVVLCLVAVVVISEARAHDHSKAHWKAYAQTAGILITASILTLVFTLITGSIS